MIPKRHPAAACALGLILGVLLSAAHSLADWRHIGNATADPPGANRIVFRAGENRVVLAFPAPDLVRVRMIREGEGGRDFSWAVKDTARPETRPEFRREGNAWVGRTAEIEVWAETEPFRLIFRDRAGRTIVQDAPGWGMAGDGAAVRCWKEMPPGERYFGLGEKAGPLDRRGRACVLKNSESYMYDSRQTDATYVSIPFFIGLRDGRAYGIFLDNAWRSSFDFGTESEARFSFGADGGELDYYFFYGPDPKKILARYAELTGRTPLPPVWSLGYQQTRYGYYPDGFVRSIARGFRERRIPCDALVLDIDYMDGYRVFTWDRTRFPDPAGLISDLRRQGFRSVLYQDPGVKAEPGYRIFEDGRSAGRFLKKADGGPFIGEVWPGDCAFPDFTSEAVRSWWGGLHRPFLEEGAAGFENDMNEPSVTSPPGTDIDRDVMAANEGSPVPFAAVRNVYGMLMTKAQREALLEIKPEERPFLTTRATFAGGQRYAAIFTGDNTATWDGLRASLQVLMSLGLSGFPHAGSEIGGFALSPSPELYARWIEAGIFYPYCRTSTDKGTRDQEPWSFGERVERIARDMIGLRYRLLPYLYGAFLQASEAGLPIIRPLLLDFPDDPEAVRQEFQFLFGDDLLVAPVVKDGETKWPVYLPAGVWYDFWTDQRHEGPARIIVDAPLERVPMFVRGGAILPTRTVVQHTDEAPIDPLILLVYPEGASSRTYREDDGSGFGYLRGLSMRRTFSATQRDGVLEIAASVREGDYVPPARSLVFIVHGRAAAPRKAFLGGRPAGRLSSRAAFDRSARGWFYDPETGAAMIRTPEAPGAVSIRLEYSGGEETEKRPVNSR